VFGDAATPANEEKVEDSSKPRSRSNPGRSKLRGEVGAEAPLLLLLLPPSLTARAARAVGLGLVLLVLLV